MRRPIRSNLIRGVLLAATCAVASLAQAASDTPTSPPSAAAAPIPPTTAPQTTVPKAEDRQAQSRADRLAFLEAHLAALHAGLQLKPDQDALWSPVETAIRGFAKLRADRWIAMRMESNAAGKQETAIDRLRHKSDRLIARGQAMKSLADAVAPLTTSLDASQKDRLPSLLEGLKPGRILHEAFAVDDNGPERSGEWRRMDHHGMGHERDHHRDREGDRGDRGHGWDRHGGYVQRDGMGGRHDHEDMEGEMPMHRHHHHDDGDDHDRT